MGPAEYGVQSYGLIRAVTSESNALPLSAAPHLSFHHVKLRNALTITSDCVL